MWVQPEEQEQITRMRAALQDELAAALPELRHDHQFLRFLRGHGGFEKAVSRPASMLLKTATPLVAPTLTLTLTLTLTRTGGEDAARAELPH